MKSSMKIFFSLVFTFLLFPAFSQKGEQFPNIETEMISGQTVELPSHLLGKYSLIGVGTSKKAEEDLRTWQTPIYNKFIAKTGLMDEMYDVNVCFLPLFTGASQAAKGKVIKKLKENNEALVINNVYVYAGSRDPFKGIGIDDKSEPYFLLLDANGKIVWYAEGSFRQKYFEEIESILNK